MAGERVLTVVDCCTCCSRRALLASNDQAVGFCAALTRRHDAGLYWCGVGAGKNNLEKGSKQWNGVDKGFTVSICIYVGR